MDLYNVQTSFEDSLINFSHDVYQKVGGAGSACVSPISIISAFLMLMAGTKGRSKTQIKSAILNNNQNDALIYYQYRALTGKVFSSTNNELYIATKLFVKQGLSVSSYVRYIAKSYFNADIGYKDFSKAHQSAIDINKYVASKTKNKIKKLISSTMLNDATVMVLVNAMYFKGTWEKQFDPANTRKRYFYRTINNRVKVDMMAMQDYVRFYNGMDYSAIALPYSGGAFEMVIVLPSQIDGFNDLKNSFSPGVANYIESQFVNTNVSINVPKFTFESETDLLDLLPKLGINDIFGTSADFSALIQGQYRNIYVSEAIHKVFIEVNEIGTTAAAATAVVFTYGSPAFIANHPFLFYIRHKPTGIVLFIGHYKA